MSLIDADFPTVLNTSDHSISNDFFLPALSNSIRYDRGVGYFSAGWLRKVISGMTNFAENGGKARILTSPILDERDWQAMKNGSEARYDEVLRDVLLKTIETDLAQLLSSDVRQALSWLVADGVLEFKLAVPKGKLNGEFHPKFGIFTDEYHNSISFEGSNNETISGTSLNWEQFKVFRSWNISTKEFVDADIKKFEQLWNNLDANLAVYNLPEAARKAILKLRTGSTNRPYSPRDIIKEHYASQYDTFPLWPHQENAIAAWEANDRIGLLSMATGSGKTRTALEAAERCPGIRLLTIAVPRKALVTQWQQELKKHTRFSDPVLVFGSSESWQDLLFRKLLDVKQSKGSRYVVCIGTMQSLSGSKFLTVLEDAGLPDNALLIVDEAHNVGSPKFQKILQSAYKWRLGLSATPLRQYDELGNEVIAAYFDKTVFTYDMANALADGRLTPYEYFVKPAFLSDDEFANYQQLTRKIIVARGRHQNDPTTLQTNNKLGGDTDQIKNLLIKRANIIKSCQSKVEELRVVLTEPSSQKTLIYCADQYQLGTIQELLNELRIVHLTYTSNTSDADRHSALEALANGRIKYLLAIDCLDEGVDVPIVDRAIIVASSTNPRQFIQRRGRILRKSKNKHLATLIDIIALPPHSAERNAKAMLQGELKRAAHMASLAKNHNAAILDIHDALSPYGIWLDDILEEVENETK